MRKSRLSKVKQDKLIEFFVAGTTARVAADLVSVNRKTAAFTFIVYVKLLAAILKKKVENIGVVI